MDSNRNVGRRDFLAVSGALSGLLAAGGPLALLASARAGADDVKALSGKQAACVLSIARTIAPHDSLEDAAYAVVVRSIDLDVAANPSTRALVSSGLESLGDGFVAATETARVQMLTAIETSEFFRLMRSRTLATLYSTELAYAHFGYEGEAFSKGGYLARGFDQLDWLPDVPLEDSGPRY